VKEGHGAMESCWIDKTEVARREIAEAVRLFFAERDPVAIHALIGAAHDVLFDLGKASGSLSALKPRGTAPSTRASVNGPYNFLKHADRDPEGKLNIAPLGRLVQDFLMDAIQMLQQVSGDIPVEAMAYWAWYVGTYPEEFNAGKGSALRELQELGLSEMSFAEIYQFLDLADILDSQVPQGDEADRP